MLRRSTARLSRHHQSRTVSCTQSLPIRKAMEAISYTAARENLAQTMAQVCNDHTPIIITRKREQSVVLISLEDFHALQETAYLVRSPKNAQRLLQSIAQLEADH